MNRLEIVNRIDFNLALLGEGRPPLTRTPRGVRQVGLEGKRKFQRRGRELNS